MRTDYVATIAIAWVALETMAYIRFRFRLYKFLRMPRSPTVLPITFMDALTKSGEIRRQYEIYKKRYLLMTMDQFVRHITSYKNDVLAEIVGSPKMSVTYKPLAIQLPRRMFVYFGRWALQSRGFTSRIQSTVDGEYRIWSRVVEGTHPMVFLPGIGAGVVPYMRWLEAFRDRTVFAIEVPNISEISDKMSYRHASSESMGDVYRSLLLADGHVSLAAHSLGTIHAAMLVHNLPPNTIESLVLMEPFCHPVHMTRSLSLMYDRPLAETWTKFAIRHLVGQDIEVQTFTRLFTNYTSMLFQPEKCRFILNILSTEDEILKSGYDNELFEYLDNTRQQIRKVSGNHGDAIRRRNVHLVTDFLNDAGCTDPSIVMSHR
jgi:pimeloyl-ACP methyl ester carboxylesterase